MTDLLQQLMNMIETTRTVPTVSGFSMIGFAILFLFGIVNCILGYRLLRFWMMLCGFIIGTGIGFGVAYASGVTEKYMYAAIMVGVGVVLAVIAFVSYKIGIFVLGAGIGIGLGIYVFHPTSSLVFFFCLLVGVGLGVLAMKRAREVLITGTSLLGGAMAGFSAARLGGLEDLPYGAGLSVGFALLGMLIQFATNRRRSDDDEEEDEEERYDDRESASDYVDPREYIPQKAGRSRKKTASKAQRASEKYADPLPLDEEELDEEVLKEMMDEDDREGEELWKKISRREEKRKKKDRPAEQRQERR